MTQTPKTERLDGLAEPRLWHKLKTDPAVFDAVASGAKTHEIRFNDRDFKVGDGLLLKRTRYTGWEMKEGGYPLEYTGESLRRVVSHVLEGYGLEPGWVILSFAAAVSGGLEGLAKFLRSQDVPGYSGPYYDKIRRWAAAVEALAAPQGAPSPEPALGQWVSVEDRMPPLGEQVLTWCKNAMGHYPMVDCWDEQHEAPVSWSSQTIPVGPGWDSGNDFYDVSHWMAFGEPSAAPQPSPLHIAGAAGPAGDDVVLASAVSTYEHERALKEGQRNDAEAIWDKQFNYSASESRAFGHGFYSGWDRAALPVQPQGMEGDAPVKLPGVAVALNMCREANEAAKLPTPMCWDLALYVNKLEAALLAHISKRIAADTPQSPDFCDTHCTWLDHHKDCVRASPAAVDAEAVAWRWRQRLIKEHWQTEADWGDWQHAAAKPQGPADDRFQMEPLFTRPVEAERDALRRERQAVVNLLDEYIPPTGEAWDAVKEIHDMMKARAAQ